MARHGKKPSEESTSSHTPRTLAGSATTNTSADSTDAAASGIAVNSSTVSSLPFDLVVYPDQSFPLKR